MQKWEYCSINAIYRKPDADGNVYLKAEEVQYFSTDGSLIDEIPQDFDGLSRTIAELGENGWEMTGVGPAYIYFKRLME